MVPGENLCESARFTGYHADGGYAQYTVAPEAFVYPLPEAFRDVEAAPLLCAGIIGYRALKRSHLPPGGRLALYGFGSSAHVVIQIAQHRGCEVYVVTRGEKHRHLARDMGAVWVGENAAEMPVKVDSAIIFAPAGELVPAALEKLQKGGTLALAGIHMSPIPPLDYERYVFYERDIHAVTCNTREDGRDLLAEAAKIPIRPHTTVYPLAGRQSSASGSEERPNSGYRRAGDHVGQNSVVNAYHAIAAASGVTLHCPPVQLSKTSRCRPLLTSNSNSGGTGSGQ